MTIYVCDTDRFKTRKITRAMYEGIKRVTDEGAEYIQPRDVIAKGLPRDATSVVVYGILRGCGHVIKMAQKRRLDYYYMDHAYFDPTPNYVGNFNVRISRNGHRMSQTKPMEYERYERLYEKTNPILPWRGMRGSSTEVSDWSFHRVFRTSHTLSVWSGTSCDRYDLSLR